MNTNLKYYQESKVMKSFISSLICVLVLVILPNSSASFVGATNGTENDSIIQAIDGSFGSIGLGVKDEEERGAGMIWLKSDGKDKIEGDGTTHPISGNYSTITIVNVSDSVNTTLASNANISSVAVDMNATEFSTTTPANATATQEFSTPTSEKEIVIVNGNGSKALIVILFVLSIILFILVIAVVSNYLYHECH